MKTSILVSCLSTALLSVATVSVSHAQFVSGSAQGAFHDPLPPSATASFDPAAGVFSNNTTFMTGQNVNGATGFTGATFNSVAGGFTNVNVAINPTILLGTFKWFNTQTIATTAANSVTFDLKLAFTAPGLQEFIYTPFNVTIDGGGITANDNLFTISAPSGGLITFGGITYNYSFAFTNSSVVLAEPGVGQGSTSGSTGISITFAAVPEPSTWALAGVGGLVLIVGARRFRRTKSI